MQVIQSFSLIVKQKFLGYSRCAFIACPTVWNLMRQVRFCSMDASHEIVCRNILKYIMFSLNMMRGFQRVIIHLWNMIITMMSELKRIMDH